MLFATTSGASATAHGETVAARLIRQLVSFGAADVTVIARSWNAGVAGGVSVVESAGPLEDLRLLSEIADSTDSGIVLACADTLAPDTAISAVMSDPTSRSGVLTAGAESSGDPHSAMLTAAADSAGRLDVAVHRDRGMVLSAATEFHSVGDPNAVAAGLLRVSGPDLDGLRAGLRRLAEENVPRLAPEAEAWRLALLALVRGGDVKLVAYEVPGLPYGRVAGMAAASGLAAEIDACDEDAVRLNLCVKRDDDLFATYCISSYSRILVKACARVGLTPVAVTWLSILFAFGAAAAFAQGSRAAMIAAAAAMYVSFVFDCVDGQLARYTHRFSAFGGWLDMIADRGKEYLVYAGLALGAASAGLTWAWPLAVAAITVQTARH
ncbi:MAG: CDP-alcohol phosphatidyltransferase family protein, partial [Stackebrandtia sp.]